MFSRDAKSLAEKTLFLHGVIEKLRYTKDGSDFRIMEVSNGNQRFVVLGNLSIVHIGSKIEMEGVWSTHERTGEPQFLAEHIAEIIPEDSKGLLAWLSSGVIKNIGPKTAKKLVDKFGDDLIRVMDEEPLLMKSCGVPESRIEQIHKDWLALRGARKIMIFLRDIGIGAARSLHVWSHFSKEYPDVHLLIEALRENPYRLCEVHGIGFHLADRAMGALQISADNPYRVRAGVLHVLAEHNNEGHVWQTLKDLANDAIQLLGTGKEPVFEAMNHLSKTVLYWDKKREIAFRHMVETERSLARNIFRLTREVQPIPLHFPSNYQKDKDQLLALEKMVSQNFFVLTGGPGMGKTSLIKAILLSAKNRSMEVLLCAPTGRAAKRMQEATGHAASTIHRLLKWRPGSDPVKNAENPIKADWLIVDEVSMMDQSMANHLLSAVESTTRVLFVGDSDQLESIRPGSVLRDLLDSGVVPFARLTKIFRTEKGSGIPVLANAIKNGEKISMSGLNGCTFIDVGAKKPKDYQEDILEIARKVFEETGETVQFLSPMKKGFDGTIALNEKLRNIYNPNNGQKTFGKFRVGDYVMQTRNNSKLEVFNGDMGTIVDIFDDEEGLRYAVVNFDGFLVQFSKEDLSDLEYAWCLTIHKSQGGQFPFLCMVATTSHYIMLRKNLIYTGITRAQKQLWLISSEKALSIVRKDQKKSLPRKTHLVHYLRSLEKHHAETKNSSFEELFCIPK